MPPEYNVVAFTPSNEMEAKRQQNTSKHADATQAKNMSCSKQYDGHQYTKRFSRVYKSHLQPHATKRHHYRFLYCSFRPPTFTATHSRKALVRKGAKYQVTELKVSVKNENKKPKNPGLHMFYACKIGGQAWCRSAGWDDMEGWAEGWSDKVPF